MHNLSVMKLKESCVQMGEEMKKKILILDFLFQNFDRAEHENLCIAIGPSNLNME